MANLETQQTVMAEAFYKAQDAQQCLEEANRLQEFDQWYLGNADRIEEDAQDMDQVVAMFLAEHEKDTWDY